MTIFPDASTRLHRGNAIEWATMTCSSLSDQCHFILLRDGIVTLISIYRYTRRNIVKSSGIGSASRHRKKPRALSLSPKPAPASSSASSCPRPRPPLPKSGVPCPAPRSMEGPQPGRTARRGLSPLAPHAHPACSCTCHRRARACALLFCRLCPASGRPLSRDPPEPFRGRLPGLLLGRGT